MTPMLNTFKFVERVAVIIGCGFLFVLMIIVTADVFMRYFLHQPLIWTHEVVTLYLMPAIFFLLLSDSMRAGAQVRVDILRDHFPRPLRSLADGIGYIGAAIGFVLIGYGGWKQCIDAIEHNEVVAGSIPWQVWPSFLLVAIGSLMLVVRLLIATSDGFRKPDTHEQSNGNAPENNE